MAKNLKEFLKKGIGKSKDVVGVSKTPDELRAKIDINSRKLENKKAIFEGKANRARIEAKNCLRAGETAKYNAAAKRLQTAQSSIKQIDMRLGQMAEMLNAIEIGSAADDLVDMNKEFSELLASTSLNIDPVKIEAASIDTQTKIKQIQEAGNQMSASMEACLVSESEEMDDLQAELMAEIEAEGGTVLSEKKTLNI